MCEQRKFKFPRNTHSRFFIQITTHKFFERLKNWTVCYVNDFEDILCHFLGLKKSNRQKSILERETTNNLGTRTGHPLPVTKQNKTKNLRFSNCKKLTLNWFYCHCVHFSIQHLSFSLIVHNFIWSSFKSPFQILI
jgi:uncharacterized membrane protein YukC